MKRILSLLLVAVMLVGLLPSALAANSSPEPQSLEATELPGVSRLEEQAQEPDSDRPADPGYQPEDLVTVIAGDPIPEERRAPEEKADRQ